MRRSRFILLVAVAISVVLFGAAWFARNHKPKAGVIFQPLARNTGGDGRSQQVFAISNLTGSTVEFALGRYKAFTTPEGHTLSNLESRAYARLASWSGTQ